MVIVILVMWPRTDQRVWFVPPGELKETDSVQQIISAWATLLHQFSSGHHYYLEILTVALLVVWQISRSLFTLLACLVDYGLRNISRFILLLNCMPNSFGYPVIHISVAHPHISHTLTSHTPSHLTHPHISHTLTSHTPSCLTHPHISHTLTGCSVLHWGTGWHTLHRLSSYNTLHPYAN